MTEEKDTMMTEEINEETPKVNTGTSNAFDEFYRQLMKKGLGKGPRHQKPGSYKKKFRSRFKAKRRENRP